MGKVRKVLYISLLVVILYILFPTALKGSTSNLFFSSPDGKRYNFADFRGKYLLVNLFSSYCPPCMVELKVLQKLHESCDTKGLQIVSLMIDRDGAPLLPKIISSRNLTYPVGLANQDILKLFPDFSITPTTYLFDPQGKRLERFVGFKNYKEWTQVLSKYVKCN